MEPTDFLKKRAVELAFRAAERGMVTHTDFLSEAEQALLMEGQGKSADPRFSGSHYFFYGGGLETERKVLFFVPDFVAIEEAKATEEAGETIACLHVMGKNAAYAETLGHRDYLGALMNLGFKREQFGDILVAGKEAYVFCFASIAEETMKNLLSVRHTYVKIARLTPKECPLTPTFEEKSINVASPRLDAVVAEAYHLSREGGRSLVEGGGVIVNDEELSNPSHFLAGGEVIAVSGHGKFVFLGEEKLSRSGRKFYQIKIYH